MTKPTGKDLITWARRSLLPPAANGQLKYLARSIVLEEGDPPRMLGATVAVLSALVLSFVLWAAIVDLSETALAAGEILPENFVQPVQHLEGGIVAKIAAREGDRVDAGDPIIILDDTAFLSELERVRARHAALSYQVARLQAFALDRDMTVGETSDEFKALAEDQFAILETQIAARDAQLSVLRDQVEQRQQQLKGLAEQRVTLERQIELVGRELEMRRELLEKGLTSKIVFLNTEREMNRVEGELASLKSDIARAGLALSEARGRYLEQETRTRSEALDEMGAKSAELAQVSEELARLSDKVERLVIAAPVSGTVKGLAVKAVGAVIGAGAVIAEVVPDNSTLVAEVRISPRDIGYVKVGKPALVKLETYDFGRYGGIEGEVTQVSAASFLNEQGEPYFRGRIKLDQAYVGPQRLGNVVTPGMTLVADIKTGEKSLLAYMVRPVERALSTAFTER